MSRDSPFYIIEGSSQMWGERMSQSMTKINDLKQLRLLLTQDAAGLKEHVYDRLQVGDMWWIPDSVSHFGKKERHPWVVVLGYSPNRPPILASPRTTQIGKRSDELLIPANLLPTLDRAGVVLLDFRRPFPVDRFREFEYIGRLPEKYIHKIQNWLKSVAGSKK